jgi:hypothetical protein
VEKIIVNVQTGESQVVEITNPNEIASLSMAPETPEQIIKRLESALDAHLDSVAQSYRYESIRTMVTYALSTNPQFASEGNAGLQLRDAVYTRGIEIISEVQVGQREIPTEEELIALMPSITDFLLSE